MRGSDGRYPPIESHAIIGDLQTAALVTVDATIDFLCLPHFDSPSVFASLLDADKGGCFAITPALDQPRHKQLYLPDTNLLLTRFLAAEGVVEISDFMPVHPREHTSRVVRRVKTVRGVIGYRVRCAPRFDYGRTTHTAETTARGIVFPGAAGADRQRRIRAAGSWTSTASCWTRSICSTSTVGRPATAYGAGSLRWWIGWRRTGGSRTTASGKCVAGGASSSIRGSSAGSRSTEASAWP